MTLWQDTPNENSQPSSAAMTDVIFKIDCKTLPVDHAFSLSNSICNQAAWLRQQTFAGVHAIHVAGSQNGWERPDGKDDALILSKRTRLKIRVQHDCTDQLIADIRNSVHNIDGHMLKVLDGKPQLLGPMPTLFSRYTYFGPGTHSCDHRHDHGDETTFVNCVIDACKQLDYQPTKVLCGKSHVLKIPKGAVTTRSVLLADVPPQYSLTLQEHGLGELRLAGCGLLIPHKDTGAV